MHYDKRYVKVGLGILFISIAATLINTGHAIDAFFPKHAAAGYEAFSTGEIPNNDLSRQLPGFHAYIAFLFHVLDINPLLLLHFPFQLVPYTVVFFTMVYLLSNGSVVFAGVLSGLQLFISSSATWRAYLWPHGMGDILFFTTIIALVVLFRKRATDRVLLFILACAVPIVYISYNLAAVLVLVLSSLYGLVKVQQYLDVNADDRTARAGVKQALLISTIATSVAILVSDFFRGKFIAEVSGGFREANLARFLLTWLETDTPESGEITHLLATEPDSIRYLSIGRYVIIAAVLFVFAVYVLNKVRDDRRVNYVEVTLLSYLVGLSFYFAVRLYIGHVAIAAFYTPGVLALAYLYSQIENRQMSVVAVVILVLLAGTVVGTQIENNRTDQINRNVGTAYDIGNDQDWIANYAPQDEATRSDELTINLLVYDRMLDDESPSYEESRDRYALIRPEQAAALTIYQDPGANQCFVLNSRPRRLTLQNWLSITSWENHRTSIHDNLRTDKVYTEGEQWVFCS